MSNTRIEKAEGVARELARRIAMGQQDGITDGLIRDIDELVGHWSDERFVWPARIAALAGMAQRA